ncbi:ABC transporter ATP-binding protein [Clostridium isatidis]|uniref:Multidrug ABC transporter ATP-binding protein n=1 Tax=Clostridium isatidis TaxID=182773 RepID=A0A343JCH3_9CLOT|nr:ABC transporter ATP-binding protein [Clostridium isatidis]ASW43231.1 multidrug ABC transporter ATP-binding protein [Clostridium isatidis]
MSNSRGLLIGNTPGRGRVNIKAGSKEKLNNPMETTKRLLKYLGDKKYILILALVFSIVTTLITILGTKLNGDIVDKYIAVRDLNGLSKMCILLVVMYVISSASAFFQNRLMVSIAQNTSARIRKDLFESIQKLPVNYYDTHSSGDLMSRLTNDVDNINNTLSQSIIQFASGLINIVGMIIAMLLLSPTLTLIGLISTPLMFIITRTIINKTQPIFLRRQKELGELNGYIEEMISSQKLTFLFGQEEKVRKEFSNKNKALTKSAIIAEAMSGAMAPIMNFINNFTYFLLAVSGGILILKDINITVGTVFTFILYMRNFNRPINEILNIGNTIQSALAGAERVFEVMDEKKEKDNKNAKELEKVERIVLLRDIEFSYTEKKKILKGINIKAEKGQTIAIVGPTGSGKTTIINLLNRFYDVDAGSILIDEENIKNYSLKSLRKSIAIVLQDTFLFEDTVRENIRYGRLDASDEEVEKAAKLANAHHFIKQLPKGYDTVLRDNGSNLSQGQRQLLAIARAMISNCSILVLDEATSSIDTRTEIQIQEALKKLMENKTTFIIAHRLSTIKNADKIIAIKDGRIIEEGTHDELMKQKGFYSELYNSQFSQFNFKL